MSEQARGGSPQDNGPTGSAGQGSNASPREDQPRDKWPSLAVCVVLALAVWAVFGQTRHDEFVNFDDPAYVTDNYQVRRGLTWPGTVWAFHSFVDDNWHPLTMLSHMLDCQFYGLKPGGHHLTNVLLHAATAMALFLALRSLTGATWRIHTPPPIVATLACPPLTPALSPLRGEGGRTPEQLNHSRVWGQCRDTSGATWRAAFVAAVFAVHPLRVESVAWVSERKDVLSGLFFMLTLWAYARFAGQSKIQKSKFRIYYWLALVFFACGLLAKPMLVTLPFVLLLLDYWPLRRLKPAATAPDNSPNLRQTWSRLILEKIPFLLLAAGDCAATLLAQKHAGQALADLTFPWRLGNALVAYVRYLWQMVYPMGLAVFYPHPRNHLSIGDAGWSALVLLVISAAVLAGRRKHPYLLVGWLWYLGMLLPVIGLMQVGGQARADRYTYLPQIGLYVMAAWGAAELCRSWRHGRVALGVGATAILAVLMVDAHAQTGYWNDSVSLWSHALACTSDNSTAHNNLGEALLSRGKLDEAIEHFDQALELEPGYVKARYNLGNALAREGKLEEAIQDYRRALELDPDSGEAHINLGSALDKSGRLEEAIQHYRRALELNPDFAPGHYDLGNALFKQGKLDEAIRHYEQALQLNPDYAQAHYNLGLIYARQGNQAAAIQHFQQALDLATAEKIPALANAARTRLDSLKPAPPQPQTP